MIRVAVFSAVVAMAISQCPTTLPPANSCGNGNNNDSGICNSCDNNGDGNGTGNSNCKKVNHIYRPVSEIACVQPIYYFFLANNVKYTTLDNACLTLFPVPDSPEEFKVYSSYIFLDGTQLIETYLTRTNPDGGNIWSNPRRTYTNFNIGYIGCGAFLRYACPSFGDNFTPFFLGFGPGVGPVGNGTGRIDDQCLETAKSLAADNGLDLGDLYVLPYKLPTRCVFHQICLAKKNPLYEQQGGFCKANNASPCNKSDPFGL